MAWSSSPGPREVTATLTTAGVTLDATVSMAWSSEVSAETLFSSSGTAVTAAARTRPWPAKKAAPSTNAAAIEAGTDSFFALCY